MREIDIALEQLVHAVVNSKECKRYREELRRVKLRPGLKEEIDDYRMRNFRLQNSDELTIEKIEQFEKEYEEFRSDPLVSDFLASELAVCRMVQNISDKLTEALEFE